MSLDTLFKKFIVARMIKHMNGMLIYAIGNVPLFIITVDSLVRLFHLIQTKIENGKDELKKIGEIKGKELAEKYLKYFGNMQRTLEYLSSMASAFGYGHVKIIELDVQSHAIIRLENSAIAKKYAELFGKQEGPVCDFFAGILKGIGEALTGRNVEVTETYCMAKGDEFCQFFIKVK